MDHKIITPPHGSFREVVCMQAGPCEGMRMGFVVRIELDDGKAGWECWVFDSRIPYTARMLRLVESEERGIAILVDAWRRGFSGVPKLDGGCDAAYQPAKA